MKGFTLSGSNGPIVSVCHAHGALFSEVATDLALPAMEKCSVCGYRKVEKAKLTAFFHEIGKRLSVPKYGLMRKAKDSLLACLDAIDTEPSDVLEILDDYAWCEKHTYRR